ENIVAEVLYEDILRPRDQIMRSGRCAVRALQTVEQSFYLLSVKPPIADSNLIDEAGEILVKTRPQADPYLVDRRQGPAALATDSKHTSSPDKSYPRPTHEAVCDRDEGVTPMNNQGHAL
ncbi:MAG: hypothetical protein ACYS4W_14185, partial [Planctomycetota bacterium]